MARPRPSPWICRAARRAPVVGAGAVAGNAAAAAGSSVLFELLRLRRRLAQRAHDGCAGPAVETRPGVLDGELPAPVVTGCRLAPGDGDAAPSRVLERVQEQVLADPAHLHLVALNDERIRTVGAQVEALLVGDRADVLAQAAQHLGRIERRDAALFVAGLQPGQVGDLVEQAVQRSHVVAQQAEEVLAALGRQVGEGESLGHVGDDTEVAAQVVRRLLPQLGVLALELAHLGERALQVEHVAGGLEPLEAKVFLGAGRRRLADLRRELGAASARTSAPKAASALMRSSSSTRQRCRQPPLARHLVQVVALLPALQAVRLGVGRFPGERRQAARPGAAARSSAKASSQEGR
jgi:hypothetical protein